MNLALLIIIFLMTCSISLLAISKESDIALLSHSHAVAKTISALQMVTSSDGDPKYIREVTSLKLQATASMHNYNNLNGGEFRKLNPIWEKIYPQLRVTSREDLGWVVNNYLRQDFNAYLVELYQVLNSKNMKSSHPKRWAAFQLDILCARFFDVANSPQGASSISPSDEGSININLINNQLNKALTYFVKHSPPEEGFRFKSAKIKWNFIENSVINYSLKAAPFLIYETKRKISEDLLLATKSL